MPALRSLLAAALLAAPPAQADARWTFEARLPAEDAPLAVSACSDRALAIVRFSAGEVRRHLRAAGFAPQAAYPNDLRAPKVMGLWVDRDNLRSNPFVDHGPKELFVIPGWEGRLARLALDAVPWLVCGEATFVARAI